MGVQASCGRPISIKKHFMFYMLPCSFEQTLASSTFWMATFKILAKTVCMNQQNNSADMISITKFYTGVIILVIIIPISVTFEIKTSDSYSFCRLHLK